MSKQFVIKTKNGCDIYVDTQDSHAATHLKNHPELFELMKEVLSHREISEDVIRFETDMGRIVGKMDRVETTQADDVFYAKRPNRDRYTRFVRGKKAQPTSFITIDLRKKSDTEYEVYTVFIGRITPSFPYGKEDPNEKGRAFWKTHALVAENQEFIPETVTRECPW